MLPEIKWLAYHALFSLAFPLMLPAFLLRMARRGGYASRMADRFALYPKFVVDAFKAGGGFVWVHAVSVGEVQVAGQFMREWRKNDPGVRFCFSTTSSTGWKVAEKEVGENDVLIYNPLDFPSYVKSALRLVRPKAVILTEGELWPTFLHEAKKQGCPVFLINARMSDRSAPRYAKAAFFFKEPLSCIRKIFAQSDLDRMRYIAAGAKSESVVTAGSFKFDAARRNPAAEKNMRDWTGEGRILLGGSTWPGEENVLLDAYRILLDRGVDLKLVIAPRHFEKADAVEANILGRGFSCARRSRGDKGKKGDVYLADTTGELMGLYALAEVVFVGKSLFAKGSQNMIEPCFCGKSVVVGPHTQNFRPVMDDLLSRDAVRQVSDAKEVEDTIVKWFTDGDGGLGVRAKNAVRDRLGVVSSCVKSIMWEIDGGVA